MCVKTEAAALIFLQVVILRLGATARLWSATDEPLKKLSRAKAGVQTQAATATTTTKKEFKSAQMEAKDLKNALRAAALKSALKTRRATLMYLNWID